MAGGAPRFTGGNAGRNTGFYAVGAAVAPDEDRRWRRRARADFDAFWDGKLAAQAKVPINPVLTPVETEVPGVELQHVRARCARIQDARLRGEAGQRGKFPALIQLQYAGVYALNAQAVARRAAEGWLILNVDSHDKLPSDPRAACRARTRRSATPSRETSYFLNMYCATPACSTI